MSHPTKGAALKLCFKGPPIHTIFHPPCQPCVDTSIGAGTSRPKTLSVDQPGVPMFVVNESTLKLFSTPLLEFEVTTV